MRGWWKVACALLMVAAAACGGDDDGTPATTDSGASDSTIEGGSDPVSESNAPETDTGEPAADAVLGSPDDGFCVFSPDEIEAVLGAPVDVFEGETDCVFAQFDGEPTPANITGGVRPVTVSASNDSDVQRERDIYLAADGPWAEAVADGAFSERPEWGDGAFLFSGGIPVACFPHVAWERVCVSTAFELGASGAEGAIAAVEALVGTLEGA